MAEEIRDENIVELTKLSLRKVILELEKNFLNLDKIKKQAYEKEIKQIKEDISLRTQNIKVGETSILSIKKEIAAKKELQNIYNEQVKLIQQSNKSIKEQNEAIRNLQRSMEEGSGKKVRDTNATFGSLFSALKGFNFKEVATTWTSAKGIIGVTSNSIAALGGAAGVASGAVTGLAIGAKMFWDNIVAPSSRMRNVAGQQLGVGVENRNLLGGKWLNEWASRAILGYSADEQRNMYSALVGAMRINPVENKAQYQTALTGMMAAQRTWGTDTQTLAKIDKAFVQVGVSSERLFPKFDALMRSLEGTGWTTSEYSNVLANNIMYLKNFGVNIDTFSSELKKYGNMIREEKLSMQDVGTGGWQGESTGNLAFMAQEFLKSGLISESELGAGLGDTVFAQAGALKEYLGKKIKAGEISEIVSLFETNPMFRGLMESSGASSNMFAFKQLMTSAGLPLSSEMSSMFGGKSAETVWDIAHGDFGATGGKLVQEETQAKLVKLATDNYALTSNAIRALLVKIAQLILDEASIMGSGSGTTPMNTNQ